MRRAAMSGLLGLVLAQGEAEAMRLAVPPSELCGFSTLVVLGEVTTSASTWSTAGSLETTADVAVARVLKGPALEDVTIVSPGGQVGNLRQWVEEAAHLEVDTRYLLFLTEVSPQRESRFTVTGGEAGAFVVPAGVQDAETWARGMMGACHAP